MAKNKTLPTNEYNQVEFLPSDWVITSATITQLKKLNVPYYKYLEGWRGFHPILKNIIPADKKPVVDEYLQEVKKRPKRKTKSTARKYAEWITDNKEKQEQIIYEYENNRATGGKAYRLLAEAYRNGDVEGAEHIIFVLMRGARRRHENTDYDFLLDAGVPRDVARELIN